VAKLSLAVVAHLASLYKNGNTPGMAYFGLLLLLMAVRSRVSLLETPGAHDARPLSPACDHPPTPAVVGRAAVSLWAGV
jgi:hypothetical protein